MLKLIATEQREEVELIMFDRYCRIYKDVKCL